MSSKTQIALQKLYEHAIEIQDDEDRFVELIETLGRINILDPNYRQGIVVNWLGIIDYHLGEYRSAWDYFNRAILISNCKDADYCWNGALALHHFSRQTKVEISKAKICFLLTKALEKNPSYFDTDIKFCKTYLLEKDFIKFKELSKLQQKKNNSSVLLPLIGISLLGGSLSLLQQNTSCHQEKKLGSKNYSSEPKN